MGYPHCPDSGRPKIYGVLGSMGYQGVWIMRVSTVALSAPNGYHHSQALGVRTNIQDEYLPNIGDSLEMIWLCPKRKCPENVLNTGQ